ASPNSAMPRNNKATPAARNRASPDRNRPDLRPVSPTSQAANRVSPAKPVSQTSRETRQVNRRIPRIPLLSLPSQERSPAPLKPRPVNNQAPRAASPARAAHRKPIGVASKAKAIPARRAPAAAPAKPGQLVVGTIRNSVPR